MVKNCQKAVVVNGVGFGPICNDEHVKMLDVLVGAGFSKVDNSKQWMKGGDIIASVITLEDGQTLERLLPFEQLAKA